MIGLKKTVSFLAGLVLLAGNCILGTAARVCCRQRVLSLAEGCGRAIGEDPAAVVSIHRYLTLAA
jgi:hypothetical protein